MTPKRSRKPDTGDEADAFGQAYARGLNLLARREHSTRELRAKLGARGIAPELVDQVTAALASEGLLNEGRFVEAYVRSRVERGYGPLKIEAELQARGIRDGLDRNAVDWVALARGARIKRFGPGDPGDFRERARQMRFLQQRGFDGGQISAVFGEIDD